MQGPAETEYGFGWIPTVTIWRADRRVHVHHSFRGAAQGYIRQDALTLEVGFANGMQPASRTPITTVDAAWTAVEQFLIQGLLPEAIGGEWVSDTYDCNKFIPHPPDRLTSANIASLLAQGFWTRWKPTEKQ